MSAEPFSEKHREYLRTHSHEQIVAESHEIDRGWRYNPHGMCWILPGAVVPDFLEPEAKQGRVICLSEKTWIADAAHLAVNEAVAAVNKSVTCAECGRLLTLCRGRRSCKWFWQHVSLDGCESVRPIFFATREEAEKAEVVFE